MMNEHSEVVITELEAVLRHLNIIDEAVYGLHEKTALISNGLANRSIVNSQLRIVLRDLELPSMVRRVIEKDECSVEFKEAVIILDEILSQASQLQMRSVRAASEILIDGSKLMKRACFKISQYFVSSLRSLGSEIGSLSALQQAAFLKFKPLYALLKKYDEEKSGKLLEYYIPKAANYHYQSYRSMWSRLDPKKIVPLPPSQLVGEIKSSSGLIVLAERMKEALTFASSRSQSASLEKTLSATSLHLTLSTSEMVQKYSAMGEFLFAATSNESNFLTEFFLIPVGDQLNDILKKVSGRPGASFNRRIQEKFMLAANIPEVVQMLLRLEDIKKRSTPGSTMESIFSNYVVYLRSRADHLILDQVKSLDMALTKIEPSQTISIITRRFIEFILTMATGLESADLCQSILQPLITAFDRFLVHSGAILTNARNQSIYLINNYDYLVHFLEAYCRQGVLPVLLTELLQQYETNLNRAINEFVVDELKPYFPRLFEFLEHRSLGGEVESVPEDVVVDFNTQVEARIKAIQATIVQLFSSYRTAVLVIGVMTSQLVTAYAEFIEAHDYLQGKEECAEQTVTPISLRELEEIVRRCSYSKDRNQTKI